MLALIVTSGSPPVVLGVLTPVTIDMVCVVLLVLLVIGVSGRVLFLLFLFLLASRNIRCRAKLAGHCVQAP